MSNALYNKLVSIEATRKDLKNILESKNINTTNIESLSGLVSEVSKLQNIDYTQSDYVWEGITEIEEPIDYYKGDDDWKDEIDIQSLIKNDSVSSTYTGKVLFLIRVSDNLESSFTSNCLKGFAAYKFSDTQELTTNIAHTWDTDKDIVVTSGERFRWVIGYVSNTTSVVYWCSEYFIPEAVIYYSGTYRGICLQDIYSSFNYTASGSETAYCGANKSSNCRGPKYFEVKESVTTQFIGGTINEIYKDSRIRTVIIDGKINVQFAGLAAPNLEYFRYSGGNCTRSFSGPNYVSNPNICSYITITNKIDASFNNFSYIQNANIYLKGTSKSIGSNFQYNEKCNIKINQIDDSINENAFRYCEQCKIDINTDVNDIGNYAFYQLYDSYIKIGIIYGNIGSYAFRDCYLFNQDIICKSNSSENKTLGSACFAHTGIRYIDLSESRLINITGSVSNDGVYNSPSSNSYRYSYSFSACNDLEEIKLSKYTLNIIPYCFYGLENLKIIDVGESLQTIGTYAFQNCKSLQSIVLPDTLKTVQSHPFKGCTNLETLYIGSPLITSLPEGCFSNLTALKYITLPVALTSISSQCFLNSTSLEVITLPETIATINTNAFDNCYNLKKVYCAGKVSQINDYAFNKCYNLEEIFDLNNLTVVGQYIFKECLKLNICLPKNINNTFNALAFSCTGARITLPSDMLVINNFNLNGSNWGLVALLDFLYSLPDRTSLIRYTITIGTNINKIHLGNLNSTDYYTSIYSNIKNMYIKDNGTNLQWCDSADEDAITIATYVSNKNWTLV